MTVLIIPLVWLILVSLYISALVLLISLAFGSARLVMNNGFLALMALMIFVPPITCLIGVWYIIAGPTRRRMRAKLSNTLSSATPEEFVSRIDQQIAINHMDSDPWLQKNWISGSHSQKRELVAAVLIELRGQVHALVTNMNFSTGEIKADLVAALKLAVAARVELPLERTIGQI